jgi:hypothetical protein
VAAASLPGDPPVIPAQAGISLPLPNSCSSSPRNERARRPPDGASGPVHGIPLLLRFQQLVKSGIPAFAGMTGWAAPSDLQYRVSFATVGTMFRPLPCPARLRPCATGLALPGGGRLRRGRTSPLGNPQHPQLISRRTAQTARGAAVAGRLRRGRGSPLGNPQHPQLISRGTAARTRIVTPGAPCLTPLQPRIVPNGAMEPSPPAGVAHPMPAGPATC